MIQVKGKKVLVMGLGRFGGGVGVARWLAKEGARVTVTDLKTKKELEYSIRQLSISNFQFPIEFTLGKHDSNQIKQADLIVLNPAIKPDSPYLKIANKNRIPWTTEINIFLERCPAKVIGITGTNGKETVVKMVEMVLRKKLESRQTKIWVGGNIGKSLLGDLPNIKGSDIVILELSSFQLAWLPIIKYSPNIAVIVNITPDHLDWHKTMAAYFDAKANILRFQEKTDVAVLNWGDKHTKRLSKHCRGTVVKVSSPARIKLKVVGNHNKWNAAIAANVCKLFAISGKESYKIIKEFSGIAHALEYIGTKNGVVYYNDSAATTVEATQAALLSFGKKVILIVGGYDKKLPIDNLVKTIKKQAKQVYTIGQTGRVLHEKLKGLAVHSGNLERAFKDINNKAKKGDIVLLSPATASYDQFDNLEQRGERFKELVLQ